MTILRISVAARAESNPCKTNRPEKGRPTEKNAEVGLIRREDKRAHRKIGFFESLKEDMRRSDAKARQASATATYVIAGIDDLASLGAKIQSARHRSGKKTGQRKQAEGKATRQRIEQCEAALRNQGIHDSLNKRIAKKLTLSYDHVRKVRKKRT